MKFAQVLQVYLNEDDPSINGVESGPYTIQALLKDGFTNQTILATPLNLNQKHIPVVGEYVAVQRGPSEFQSGAGFGKSKFYYTSPLGLQKNINNNILENAGEIKSTSAGEGFAQSVAGIATSTNPQGGDKKNKEFKEVADLSQLQPFAGDVIHEGRFGQSIRFGYTPQGAQSKQQPTWKSTKSESPITIIRNGAGESNGYNKYVVEDINKDASSIWLTDQQTISLTLGSTLPLGVTPTSVYNKPQVILNSDRIVLNSKKDNVILTSSKDIVVSTSKNTTTIDKLIEAIEILAQGTYPIAGAATGPHPQIAQILAKIKNGVG